MATGRDNTQGRPPKMHPVFLSDLHLKPEGDEARIKLLVRFLKSLTGRVDHVFLLGDLFDFYIDFPDAPYYFPAYQPVFEALAEMVQRGTHVVYFEGNHDFRYGHFISHALGLESARDEYACMLDGYNCYMAHGDLVNTNDTGYLRLRSFLRGRLVSLLLRVLPPTWIVKMGLYFSRKSRAYTATKTDNLDSIYRGFAKERWEEGFDVVVLGHNHRKDNFEGVFGGRRRLYLNLGVWADGSFPFLELTPSGFVFGDVAQRLRDLGTDGGPPANIHPLRTRTGSGAA